MSGDVVQVVAEITPYITAAAGAYGVAVLARTQEEAATATVALGRRLAQRIFGTRADGEELPEALADVVEDPDDPDNTAALRKAVRKALLADGELAADVRELLARAPAAVRTGDRSQTVVNSVIVGDAIQIGSIGGDAHIGSPDRA
ncbi:hypothetical protein [Streptomyces curacoi]|uniref:Uncharacterized protein n=1 Tax=Streptomyces curacoi TaxID=146536 RepID=A0A124GUN0_9ACTN|nr:hypothetical protein [Streptomyces curacoi]KUM67981.1 hypothetical protein AQI70_34635 [Streptomyces curacoi]